MTESIARKVLCDEQALLVHFSTVMADRQDLLFPRDLQRAMELVDVDLSFSTILVGDSFRNGAEGTIGMLVDIAETTAVRSVYHGDSGSSSNGSLGHTDISERNCRDSFKKRTDSNEWRVSKYKPLGIFTFRPIIVRQEILVKLPPEMAELMGVSVNREFAEREIQIKTVLDAFPAERIFGTSGTSWQEYSRTDNDWRDVAYNAIINSGG